MADEPETTQENKTDTTPDNEVNLSSVIREQSNTIKTLVDNIKAIQTGESTSSSQSPVFLSSPQATEAETPNYVMYASIGLGVWLLLKKGKLI